jgi:E3 ubiquitin-protein ligase TRIP12
MALISRTLRLKLAAEDPADVPKSCQSLMVSIHAIAPFSALEDYLKPRIAGILSFRPELSPGLLQALAGSGLPSSTLAQSMLARLTARVGSGSSGSSGAGAAGTLSSFLSAITGPSSTESGPSTPATATAGTASGSLPIPIPARRGTGESGSSTSTLEPPPPPSAISEGSLSRRRSLRLRGQPPADPQASTSTNAEAPAQASSSTSAPIPAPPTASSETRAALASSLLHQLLVDEAELEDDLDGEVCLSFQPSTCKLISF